ncbi:flocculation protein FLO11 [Lucilia cuprina]|uniref:flocculation protein FLO11 n=1 Tax=Lucilia cuprina TaxID=7375 RepID=UPI001F0524DB|nr:flocculation protein FLO11 [Lucilia cuprina]
MLKLLSLATLLTFSITIAAAGNVDGYHYDKPTISLGLVSHPTNLAHGHSFGPLPTTQPLPPVPSIPALPTARANKGPIVQTRTLLQTHPATTTTQIVPSTYLPSPGTAVTKIAQQYQTPGLQSPPSRPATSTPSAPAVRSTTNGFGFSTRSTVGTSLNPTVHKPAPPPSQPLRVPFGKQYAVIEIIDNDLEQNNQPFLSSPFIDTFRAHIGASGTGATPGPVGGIQIGTRSGANLLGQQRSSAQSSSGDAVALGSGGLGFIRLANGNVYLGSGSLGYISGQQHSQEINEARTRTGAPQPDPLHFGHGALGTPPFHRFVYRF